MQAQKIQSVFRGFVSRRTRTVVDSTQVAEAAEVSEAPAAVQQGSNAQKESKAAVKIQSTYRGHEARRDQRALSLASSTLLGAVVEAQDRADVEAASDAIERLSDGGMDDKAVNEILLSVLRLLILQLYFYKIDDLFECRRRRSKACSEASYPGGRVP